MMEGRMKESFIMHNSFYEPIKSLNDEQLGRLFRAIFNYTSEGIITKDNEILIAFMFIKNQIDMDASKWEEQKKKRSEAGKKGMQNRWHNNDNNVIDSYNDDINVKNVISNITDNVNVNVNDNVNVINKERNIKKEVFKKPSISEIEEYCKSRNNDVDANRFYDYYEANNWKDRDGKKIKSWKQKLITWEGRKKNNEKLEKLPNWFDKNMEKDISNLDELNKILEEFK